MVDLTFKIFVSIFSNNESSIFGEITLSTFILNEDYSSLNVYEGNQIKRFTSIYKQQHE